LPDIHTSAVAVSIATAEVFLAACLLHTGPRGSCADLPGTVFAHKATAGAGSAGFWLRLCTQSHSWGRVAVSGSCPPPQPVAIVGAMSDGVVLGQRNISRAPETTQMGSSSAPRHRALRTAWARLCIGQEIWTGLAGGSRPAVGPATRGRIRPATLGVWSAPGAESARSGAAASGSAGEQGARGEDPPELAERVPCKGRC
jgi:hypothetical protein